MTNEELKTKLKLLSDKKDSLTKEVQRITLQQEAVRLEKEKVERECLALGLRPEDLPSKIEELRNLLFSEISQYETKLQIAQKQIDQYNK